MLQGVSSPQMEQTEACMINGTYLEDLEQSGFSLQVTDDFALLTWMKLGRAGPVLSRV